MAALLDGCHGGGPGPTLAAEGEFSQGTVGGEPQGRPEALMEAPSRRCMRWEAPLEESPPLLSFLIRLKFPRNC